jgi:GNAT superfamily N-acetyltransferase
LIQIERLDCRHDRRRFDCGQAELNRYLQTTARQHAEKGIAQTFVLIDAEAPQHILGFYTLTVCEVQTGELPVELAKKYPARVPGARLARLAIAIDRQRQGLGRWLMVDAMRRALLVSEQVGIMGFFVDAKDQAASRYYQQYGFLPLPDNPLQLVLPLRTLQLAFG